MTNTAYILEDAGFNREQVNALTTHFEGTTATKADLLATRSELKEDIADLRSELKEDIADLRSELKEDMSEFRTEVKTDIERLNGKIDHVASELHGEMKEMRSELNGKIDSRFTTIMTLLVLIGAAIVGQWVHGLAG